MDFLNGIDESDLEVLSPGRIWYIGYSLKTGLLNFEPLEENMMSIDYARKQIKSISRLYPGYVGAPGGYISIAHNTINNFSPWKNWVDFAVDQISAEPYYLIEKL